MVSHKFKLEGCIKSPIIMCLHGFQSSILDVIEWGRVYNLMGYTVIGFNARGHGNNNGKMWRWKETVFDYDNYLNTLKKPVIIIGHSMGGTQSIYLCKNKYVKKVFAVSALHDNRLFESNNKFLEWKYRHVLKKKDKKKMSNSIYPILPESYTLTKKQSEKLYLVHDQDDPFIIIDHFKKNRKKFHVPAKRCLVSNFQGHVFPPYNPIIQGWILNKIKKN